MTPFKVYVWFCKTCETRFGMVLEGDDLKPNGREPGEARFCPNCASSTIKFESVKQNVVEEVEKPEEKPKTPKTVKPVESVEPPQKKKGGKPVKQRK